ncbi:MAG: hypothetical protein JMN24_15475 [gamma proteobacterium endosymbiont of Lamellibrachia anaximandri]|nr:hypothetical protein [gamma proteobacterium endosymbiont of Lamellibrachia anaximandri]MBL3619488.1 hypothetical protein [gamma proteobacterium endosymbiont of Lamellibrachia anaximandri]
MLRLFSHVVIIVVLIGVTGCNTTPERARQTTSEHCETTTASAKSFPDQGGPCPTSKKTSDSSVSNVKPTAQDELLIIYGGFGLLHTEAQPEFTKLWKTNSQKSRALRARLERAAIGVVQNASLPISSYPVALTNDDVLNILADRLGERPQWVRFKDIESAFSRVYVLVVTAGLELHAAVPYRAREFEQYGHHFIAGASAMLVEMGGEVGSSRVVLSTTALREIEERRTQRNIAPEDLTEQFANAYEKAAAAAIQDLLDIAQKRGMDAIDELSERSMVTSVIMDDETSRELFNFKSIPADTSCRVSTPCRSEGGGCAQIASLIAHKSTEVLGRQDRIMLPPLRWAVWGGLAGERAAVTLSLSRGIDAVEDTLQINVSKRSADEKIASILNGVAHADYDVKGTDKLFRRFHIASLSFCNYRTDSLNTEKVTQRELIGPVNNIEHENQELRVVGELPNPPDVERAFKIISIWNALENYK